MKSTKLRILIVEDSPQDAELAAMALRRGGFDPTYELVDTRAAMAAKLEQQNWDLVISDYSMPSFGSLEALKVLREIRPEVPFILISGTIGEEMAVAAMRAGADDYVLKTNLERLPMAVERELEQASERRERKRIEERYRNLVDRIPIGVFTIAGAGSVVESNPAFREILGFSGDASLESLRIESLPLYPEKWKELTETLAREHVVRDLELQLKRQDGSAVWCAVSARAVSDASGDLVQYEGVCADISERKLAEEEIRHARDLALAAAQIRSEFIHNISHEIRTPLSAIVGTAELMLMAGLPAEQSRRLAIVQSSGELLLTIVNDILDFSKLSAGKMAFEQVDFDLIEVVEHLIESFAAAARTKAVGIALQLDVNVTSGLRGDPSRLRQILNNLVSNAIKFTPAGEILVRVAKLEDNERDVLIRFDVVDPGVGIPREVQARLFQPFVQAEGSTSRHYGGTGLGLVIAAQLTAQMGGTMGFESTLGKGSTFHFTARLEKANSIERPWMSASAGSCFRDLRALIVYENPIGRQVIADYLTAWGFENIAVANGAEALGAPEAARSRGGKYSLLVIEEKLADMTALEFLKTFKSDDRFSAARVVMLTSIGRVDHAPALVDSTVIKPIRPSDLYARLVELFREPRRGDAVPKPAAAPDPVRDSEHRRRKGVRILCVDDNAVNRTIVGQQLAALGYTAIVVEDAAQALGALSREKFDIVLMDCEMPGMNGYQATAEIRKRERGSAHTIIIALTAHATEGDQELCLRAGMDGYISKPVKMKALASALDEWAHRGAGGGKSVSSTADGPMDASDCDDQLDPEAIAEIAELGDDLLGKLVEDFLSDFDGRIASMEDALDAQDLRLLASIAHFFKSASATLGAKRFSALCAKVEARALAGDQAEAISSGRNLVAAAHALPAILTSAADKSARRPLH
ncbi:MAG TPA: response regulator [Candidatus Acidoferrales bacterium]|nr:response regulator [Candidatus Acidoferrales bacterium]